MTLCALGSVVPHAATVTFQADGMHCRVAVPGVASRHLRAITADSLTARSTLDSLLDSLGFFSAAWDTVSAESLVLRPGPRTVVDSILIAGDTAALGAAQAPDQAPPSPGLPRFYDAGELRAHVTSLLERLGQAGYPFARADLRVERTDKPGDSLPRVRLEVTLTADCRYLVDSTAFIGTQTRRRQLLRDTRLAPGTPYNLAQVRQGQQRLASREYTDSVEVLPPILRRAPDQGDSACTDSSRVVVPFRVADRRGLTLEGALGLEQDPELGTLVSGMLDFGLLNVLGAGERAALTYRGDRTLQRLTVRVGKMHVGAVPLGLDGRFVLEIARDEYAFMEGALETLYELRGPWRAGAGVHVQENTVSESLEGDRTWHVYGLDLLLDLPSAWPRRGVFTRGIRVRSGAERAYRGEEESMRWRLDVGAELQAPLGRRLALGARLMSWNVFTDEERLTPAEMYRVGGYRTLRGYPDDYLAARNAAVAQLEYMVYLAGEMAAFIFTDGGAGWREGIEHSSTPVWMMGYGVGIRLPARIGSATVEWGRSIDDRRGFGRIHVRIANRLAQGLR